MIDKQWYMLCIGVKQFCNDGSYYITWPNDIQKDDRFFLLNKSDEPALLKGIETYNKQSGNNLYVSLVKVLTQTNNPLSFSYFLSLGNKVINDEHERSLMYQNKQRKATETREKNKLKRAAKAAGITVEQLLKLKEDNNNEQN